MTALFSLCQRLCQSCFSRASSRFLLDTRCSAGCPVNVFTLRETSRTFPVCVSFRHVVVGESKKDPRGGPFTKSGQRRSAECSLVKLHDVNSRGVLIDSTRRDLKASLPKQPSGRLIASKTAAPAASGHPIVDIRSAAPEEASAGPRHVSLLSRMYSYIRVCVCVYTTPAGPLISN